MTADSPDRTIPFDPSSGSGPEGVLLPPREGGEVVAVLADASVRGDLWAERAAVALAREWSERGREVILLDGDVETPSLHDLLETENREGLSDALLYGASLDRVTVTPPGEAFRVVTSGTVVADPAAFRGSDRWDAFLQGFRSRGEVAVLFLPSGGAGAALLAARGNRTLRMARPGSPAPEGLSRSVLLHPPGASPATPPLPGAPPPETSGATVPEPEPTVPGPEPSVPEPEPTSPVLGDEEGGEPAAAPSSSSATAATARPSPVIRTGPRPRTGGGRRKVFLIVLLLLLVLAILGAWLGLLEIPGFS